MRFFSLTVERFISSTSRYIASLRFLSWLRKRCALMTMIPSLLIRLSLHEIRRALQGGGKEEAFISKRRCTALETLLTFWPPAPWARMALISISLSGMLMLRVMLMSISIGPGGAVSCQVDTMILMASRRTLVESRTWSTACHWSSKYLISSLLTFGLTCCKALRRLISVSRVCFA